METITNDPLSDFRQKVVERLKNEVGTMLPDDALAALTTQAVQEIFYKPSRIRNPNRGWNEPDMIDGPSWFRDAVEKAAKPLVEAEVKRITEEQKKLIVDTVTSSLETDKLLLIAAPVIGQSVRDAIIGVGFELVQELRNQGIIRG